MAADTEVLDASAAAIQQGPTGPIYVIPPEHAITQRPSATPADLLRFALDSGADLDRLERLYELQVRHEAREAEKAFNEAMAAFKANPPVIAKDKHVNYTGAKGTVDYDHATHYGVTKAIAEALGRHGLSHSWRSTQEGDKITVTCTIKHRLGHSDSTSMTAGYDGSGGKNAIQAIGSAKTYLERYTLLGLTGLSTQDQPDDDGAGAAPPQAVEAVLQGLKETLSKTKTEAAAIVVWESAKHTLHALGDQSAYEEFKADVVAHRVALKGAAAEPAK